MKNEIINEAIEALAREAFRVKNKKTRESLQRKIDGLLNAFTDIGDVETDNPPGKTVIRDKKGNAIGVQG